MEKSKDSLVDISLHDCVINKVLWNKGKLIFKLDWIDVLPTHPNNCTGKAKTGESAWLVFEDATVEKAGEYDVSAAINAGKKQIVLSDDGVWMPKPLENIAVDFLILSFVDEAVGEYRRFLCTNVRQEIEIKYARMWVTWQNLVQDAWFEGWPKGK